jgi:predicted acylesterase/phospholipase RssA
VTEAPSARRDVALVLSGGGINGVLLELGFLKRLRETPLWPRTGWIYGTSAGALCGTMAALDRLDELEGFLLGLRAEDVFRPRRMWQLPLGGLRDYMLPETIAERLGAPDELGSALAGSEIELVVFATDVSDYFEPDTTRHFELVYSSHSTPNETMGRAILASAAVSALVLPIRIEGSIATDGGWVRNFPLEHANANPGVRAIAAFRYLASYRPADLAFLARLRERLERFRAVPPVRALLAEVRLAEERATRGEPAHYPELIIRLMRVAVARNTVLEERLSAERDLSVRELHRLRDEVVETAVSAAPRRRRRRLRADLVELFANAEFPFPHEHPVRRLIVRAAPGEDGLDPTYRGEWEEASKLALIERGYRLTEDELTRDPSFLEAASGSEDGREGSVRAHEPRAVQKAGPGRPGPVRG